MSPHVGRALNVGRALKDRPALTRALVTTVGRGVCVLVVAGLTVALGGGWGAHRPASWVWLGATALVALTVMVTRAPLERLADRAAYGAEGDPYAVLSGFVARIADTLAVDDVLPHLARTVTQALHSPRGEVTLWLADGAQWRQTWPPEPSSGSLDVDVALEHHGQHVGQLGLAAPGGDLSADDRALLSRLAGTAGLALSNVRLTYDLRRRLAESTELATRLEQSRQRLLEAAAGQTRRFSVMVDQQVQNRLRAARQALDRVQDDDPTGVDDATRHATAALAALRELAAGVFPPALVDRGLAPALEGYGARYDGRVAVRADDEDARAALEVEAAAYFCAVQLVEDCIAHGPVGVEIAHLPGELELRLSVASAPESDTLRLVQDRVEASHAALMEDAGAGPANLRITWPLSRHLDQGRAGSQEAG